MSRQIQIRRGTAAENNAFTGAIGEITMDTTNNTLRVHDGSTLGGTILAKKSEIPAQQELPANYDFVVDFQEPTAQNNYTWYRKYKSGWIEQGGYIGVGSSTTLVTIQLPITMANTNYNWNLGSSYNSTSNATWRYLSIFNKTTSCFDVYKDNNISHCWEVRGMAADNS